MRRLHPYSGGVRALSTAVSFGSLAFFLGVMLGVTGGADALDVVLSMGLAIAGGLAGLGYGVARYLRFEYETSEGTVSIASGVLSRQERDIPYGRIQNVDIRRGILYRILGLAIVNMETAGGGNTEAVLNAVDLEEARRIQNAVAGYEQAASAEPTAGDDTDDLATDQGTGDKLIDEGTGDRPIDGDAAETATGTTVADRAATSTPVEERNASSTAAGDRGPTRETIFELSTNDLALLSIVGFDPSGLALLIFSIPFGQEFAFEILASTVAAAGGPTLPSLEAITGLGTVQLVFVLLVGAVQFVLAAWVASAAITAIKYYDFRLTRVGEDLRYERGLLGRYTGTIPLEKVQTVTVRENVPMRRFGFAALDLETAGYGPNQGGSASNTAIPLDDREVVLALAERLTGVEYPTIERPPRRSRRRYAVRMAFLPIGLAALLFAGHTLVTPLPRWWIPLLALALAPVAGHLMWKHRGHALTDGAFLARSGFWRRHTRIVPYYRIQTVIDSRTIFQRWRDLASVTADTASTASLVGGDATAHDVDEETAVDLHHTLRERLDRDLRRHQHGDGTAIGGDPSGSLRVDVDDADDDERGAGSAGDGDDGRGDDDADDGSAVTESEGS